MSEVDSIVVSIFVVSLVDFDKSEMSRHEYSQKVAVAKKCVRYHLHPGTMVDHSLNCDGFV